MLQVPPETRDLLLRSMKVKAGMTTDKEGLLKVAQGLTTIEEVLRVTGERDE